MVLRESVTGASRTVRAGHLAEQLTALVEAPLGGVVGDRWLYGREGAPDRERLEDYTDARLTGLIRTAAGLPDLRVRVVAKGAFSFAAQVADRYRSGRAFLVGDAAQRMTRGAAWA